MGRGEFASRAHFFIQRLCTVIASFEWLILVLILPAVLFPTPGRALILLILPLLWMARKVTQGRFVPATPLDWSLFGLLFMLLVSLYATFDLAFSLPKIAGVLYGVALYYATVAAVGLSSKHLAIGVSGLLGSGVMVASFGLLGAQWSAKAPALNTLTSRLPQRLVSLPGAADGFNANQVAGTLLWVTPLALVLAIALLAGKRQWPVVTKRWLAAGVTVAAWLAALFLAGVLLLTQSRGALLGFITALIFMALVVWRWPRRLAFIALLAFVLVAAGWWRDLGQDNSFIRWFFQQSTGNAAESDVELITVESRVEIWSRALYGIQDFPFTGMGIGTFRRVVPLLYPLFLIGPDADIAHAHNHLLQTALDLGIPGLIAYLATWLGAAGMLWQIWRRSSNFWWRSLALGFAASLLGYFIYGITDTIALGARPGFIFWLLLGLIASLHRLNDENIQHSTFNVQHSTSNSQTCNHVQRNVR